MAAIRVSDVFVMRFEDALARLERTSGYTVLREHAEYHQAEIRAVRRIPRKLAIEEFIDEIKYELAQVLLSRDTRVEVKWQEKSPSTRNNT